MNTGQQEMHTSGCEALQRILEGALQEGADAVEFEYVYEGLEVCKVFSFTGFGDVVTDKGLAGEIMGAIVEGARLDKEPRGKMQMDLLGKPHSIVVEEYDSFGESSFRLILRERDRGEAKRGNG